MTIIQQAEDYIALKRFLGYKFEDQATMLRKYAAFADTHDDIYIQSERVIEWASQAPSLLRSREWLRTISGFAASMNAEDERHQIPPRDVFGKGKRQRPPPYILSLKQIANIMRSTRSLPPIASLTPHTYHYLFGLIAVTGLRVSEAVALKLDDITPDGLVIRETKFKKSRLLPITSCTHQALQKYLSLRQLLGGVNPHVFVLSTGLPPDTSAVARTFGKLCKQVGLPRSGSGKMPRVHDLRHSFAVRALERCDHEPSLVKRHMLALSTYLGHACLSDTYWYLEATPALLKSISETSEKLYVGGEQ